MSKRDQAFELFDQGKRPANQEVKQLGLKAKTTYNYFQLWKKSGGTAMSEGEEGKQVKTSSSSLPTTENISNAQVVRFHPHVINCQFTPIMYVAMQAATQEWNWPAEMRFEDFVDTVLYHFFKDRGIILQGYIVEGQQDMEG